RNGLRFVVIDGSEESLFCCAKDDPQRARAVARLKALEAQNAVNAQSWNGGISETQLAWLADVLADASVAGEKVVVMGHYPLYPQEAHNMWDWQQLVDLFQSSGSVLAYLSG